MDIAILHHHFRIGGVTSVIEMAREALEARGHRAVLIGGEPQPGIEAEPALAYGRPASEAGQLMEGVESACRRRFGRPADILHIHNHSLGKNGSLPAAVAAWAEQRRPMVLQLHDFAENGRPANYQRLIAELGSLDRLYPHSPRVRLAVLTRGAAARIEAAGAPAAVLPNPVRRPRASRVVAASELGAERLVVYPTRAIRRKNLGEFLLHASRARAGEIFAVTGAPADGPGREIYDGWVRWAEGRGLPVVFDACRKLGAGFGDVLAGAALAVTTSVEEGFGMAFVEPLAAGVPLAGRDLPEVTADFKARSLPLANLYSALPVPAACFDAERFLRRFERGMAGALAAYRREPGRASAADVSGRLAADGFADFGLLDEEAQREVIERGVEVGLPALEGQSASDLLQAAKILEASYGSAEYAFRLERLYLDALAGGAESPSHADPEALLDAFLDFRNFSPLRF
ncbi:MAG: glycosyltransferase [Terrimicrobiaceae bacterium]|nr:glycosyltransferase [Terrimicrobiaceae bacterium]